MSGQSGIWVVPGQRLADASEYAAGSGTYALDGQLYASVVGRTSTRPVKGAHDEDDEKKSSLLALCVEHDARVNVIPKTGDTVIGKVLKINSRLAKVSIVVVGNQLLKEPFDGTIRTHDVRAFEVDSVEIYKSFRPGDVVKAEVISIGDARAYYLSTAKNELGVILAHSAAGHTMVPVSWEEMLCPVTKEKEFRKVAKVVAAS